MTGFWSNALVRSLAAFVAAVGLLMGLGAAPASAAHARGFTVAYSYPSQYWGSYVGGIFSGHSVTMYCWVDSPHWAFGTNRWFKVRGFGYKPNGRLGSVTGYVSANKIGAQSRVPHC